MLNDLSVPSLTEEPQHCIMFEKEVRFSNELHSVPLRMGSVGYISENGQFWYIHTLWTIGKRIENFLKIGTALNYSDQRFSNYWNGEMGSEHIFIFVSSEHDNKL